MAYRPVEENVKLAVEHLREMLRNNRDWSFNYCLRFVANQWRIDIGYLRSQYNTMKTPKTLEVKKKHKSPDRAYGGEKPYWLKD